MERPVGMISSFTDTRRDTGFIPLTSAARGSEYTVSVTCDSGRRFSSFWVEMLLYYLGVLSDDVHNFLIMLLPLQLLSFD